MLKSACCPSIVSITFLLQGIMKKGCTQEGGAAEMHFSLTSSARVRHSKGKNNTQVRVKMNPIKKFVLKLLSSPRIDMQEDYMWIRKMQDFFAPKPKKGYRILDSRIFSKDNSHDIPVRVFHPQNKLHDDVILFFHGGGWVLGNIDTYTNACITMAEETGRIVLSVDYRKAPEYPFPAGFDDCFRVAEVLMGEMALAGIPGATQLSLVGDSSGGNLAAAVSLRLRDEGLAVPQKQVLIYPVTYWDHTEQAPFESLRLYGHDYGLTSKKMQEYMEMYEPDEMKRKNAYIAPLMATDLSGQPDTLVVTAEYDPLRDEGEAYGNALAESGNTVVVHRMKDAAHNFLNGPRGGAPINETYQLVREFLNGRLEGETAYGEQEGRTAQELGSA